MHNPSSSLSLQRWFHMFIPKRLEQDSTYAQDHTQSHTHSLQGANAALATKQENSSAAVNSMDISKILSARSLKEKR